MQPPKRPIKMKLGFMLHKKYSMHLLIGVILNYIASATILGFSIGLDQPFIKMKITGYIFAIIMFTLLENLFKLFMFKYFLKMMVMSFGLVSYILMILLFLSIDYMFGNEFEFYGVEQIMMFVLLFGVLRFIITYYYQKHRLFKTVRR